MSTNSDNAADAGSPSEKPAGTSFSDQIRERFASFWAGKERLWKTYWLLGGGIGLLFLAAGLFMRAAGTPQAQALFIAQLLMVPTYTFWIVSVWRSAWRTSHWIWSLCARGCAISAAFTLVAVIANLLFFGGKL